MIFLGVALLTVAMISCKKPQVTDVTLNKTELTLHVGETETLIAIVLPKDAGNTEVNWKSDDTEVATVDETGKVIAKTIGNTIVTVTTVDGNKTAKCTVAVISPDQEPEPIIEPEMIFVEGGTFMYGFDDGNVTDSVYGHSPPSERTIADFYISKYPVTQKLWKAVMGRLPGGVIGGDDYPVYNVNLYAVWEFIDKLNLATGKKYTLPDSERWEYAAKGGAQSQGYKYSGSNNIDEVAWYNGNSNNSMHPVGEKQPNELGIYDMSGNVREWAIGLVIIDPLFKKAGMVDWSEIRGGSHCNDEYSSRILSYSVTMDRNSYSDLGFRLILIP